MAVIAGFPERVADSGEPTVTVRPATVAVTPRPTRARKPLAGSSSMPRSRAAATIACPIGCSLGASAAAARASRSSSPHGPPGHLEREHAGPVAGSGEHLVPGALVHRQRL